MRWNLRLTAANKGIRKAAELQRSLAEHGLVLSAGTMSGLWSVQPISLELEDRDVIRVVLGCEIGDLPIPKPGMSITRGTRSPSEPGRRLRSRRPAVAPKRRDGRPLPPT
ncbi:helix-turn-helix transcriptional regulator [Streptomyces sp. SID3343]|uniref:helix-turn-helix domain-containing protein n=1 Tax=Streptomyces sp. SID3343 TaxID=2690260 RepID=UPI00136F8D1B|nr:helix-turn-helix transcriptional regulator [Streptomyces sp. SID3343]MYV97070.1 helix-turn-helix domain-containing protein [Streptomyces sp. SID3343]